MKAMSKSQKIQKWAERYEGMAISEMRRSLGYKKTKKEIKRMFKLLADLKCRGKIQYATKVGQVVYFI